MIARLACLLCLAAAPLAAQQQTESASGAVLRALDKLTGSSSDLPMAAGSVVELGRLQVRLRGCRYPTGNPAGDAFASVEIRETGQDSPVFDGWMIASAPALSALDHAQYDVWVIRCTTS